MGKLQQIANDLAAFDSDDPQYISEWTPAQAEIAKRSGEEAAACASIGYNGACGFANGGAKVYLYNGYSDSAVRATVRVNWRSGIESGSYDRVHDLPAGSQKYLGCTDSGGIPITYYSYSVVGCHKV